jgi:flagellar export protein FliJ
MKRFQFSLQALHKLLEQKEQASLLRYLRLVSLAKRLQEDVQQIWNQLDIISRGLRTRLDDGCPALELQRLQDFCQSVKQNLAARERDLQSARVQCDLALSHLLAARKSSAMINRYHDIQEQRHSRACLKQEQKFLDELGQRTGGFPDSLQGRESIRS